MGALTNGDDHAVSRVQFLGIRHIYEGSVFLFFNIFENHAVICDFYRRFVVDKLHAFQTGVAEFVVAGCRFLGDGKAGEISGAFADGGSGHVHGSVAGADDNNSVPQLVAVRIVKVIDAKVYMAQGLAFDVERIGLPHAGAYEDGFVPVTEQIVNADGASDVGVGAELDAF